jgi:hypothetical protein
LPPRSSRQPTPRCGSPSRDERPGRLSANPAHERLARTQGTQELREDDYHSHLIAAELDLHHANWMVFWGCYRKLYRAFPLGNVNPSFHLISHIDPAELERRMRQAEVGHGQVSAVASAGHPTAPVRGTEREAHAPGALQVPAASGAPGPHPSATANCCPPSSCALRAGRVLARLVMRSATRLAAGDRASVRWARTSDRRSGCPVHSSTAAPVARAVIPGTMAIPSPARIRPQASRAG